MASVTEAIKLYQFPQCPYCKKVREKLEEMALGHEIVDVPNDRNERQELFRISGQRLVPVLVYGERVVTDSSDILIFLDELE